MCRALASRAGVFVSEVLCEPRLLQYTVGGVARLDLVIDGEPAIGDWAFPHVMIAVAAPYEPAAGLVQNPLQFRREVRHRRSLDGLRELALAGDQLERDSSMRGTGSVQLKHLGDHALELAIHLLDCRGLGDQPRHVGIRDVPHGDLRVPVAGNGIGLGAHGRYRTLLDAIERQLSLPWLSGQAVIYRRCR